MLFLAVGVFGFASSEPAPVNGDCDGNPLNYASVQAVRDAFADQDPHLVNGVVPPGIAVPSSAKGLNMAETYLQNHYAVFESGRPSGYRTPIHVHQNTQHVCVLKGKITNYVEGKEPYTVKAGECYIMTKQTKMATLSVGDENFDGYLLWDIFAVPQGSNAWVVLEPDALWVQDAQFGDGGGAIPDNLGEWQLPEDKKSAFALGIVGGGGEGGGGM